MRLFDRRPTTSGHRAVVAAVGALCLLLAVGVGALPASAADPCLPPVSVIACENSKPGNPSSEWQISGAGSSTIQGFATSMSVNPGDTVRFKIRTPATRYHIDIYRMGYYQGNGARRVVAGLQPSATLPQTQPTCLNDTAPTGLVDCGNWAVSASWAVPSTAVSGVYLARLIRDDTSGTSHITFVVKNDAGRSDMLFQTSDQTWQAYNTFGGNSTYSCQSNCPPGNPTTYKGASKVSYNRPFNTAVDSVPSWLMSAEYPMIRFLEANGYDVSYTSGVDVGTPAGGALLTNHKVFLSVGHDEYWSGPQRANVEAARDAGVNLAFFSGNEVFWKTRSEPSIDGTGTANRTLVTYKETHYDGVVDPQGPPTWTGTWQDPRFSPPSDGGRPQNALTGQLFTVNSGSTDIKVPAQYGGLRFWRNTSATSLAPGQTLTLAPGQEALGYEWDVEPDNGFRPAGLFNLSSTTYTNAEAFTDYGSTVQAGSTATHRMSLYRAASGALVFGAGTVQWSWGLDDPFSTPDRNMRQATVNLFADMDAQPYALGYTGLVLATKSTDTIAPTSTITSPDAGASVGDGTSMTINGTAADSGGGVVAAVEVSTDGGTTWHRANGTTTWSYTWVAHGNPTTTLRSRAVDDSANIEVPSAGRQLAVGCTCSIWGTASTPGQVDSGSATAVEVGVKFRSDVSGRVSGVRFYKSSRNTGTHVGNLWTTSGTRLATVTFANETASGWQQALFSTPVAINANTTYVVSYFAPNGHTAQDVNYLYPNPSPRPDARSHVDSPPLHALRNTNGVVNGLYRNAASSGFPTATDSATNYWVDVMFTQNTGPATVPGAPTGVQATPGNGSAVVAWSAPPDGGSAITGYTVTPFIGSTPQPTRTVTGNPPATNVTVPGLVNGTAYTFTVRATNVAGTGPASAESNSVTPAAVSCSSCSLWPSSAVPSTPDQGDPNSIEVGVKFRADLNGEIMGLRFYKAPLNTGTHVGSLWTASGTRLASVTFGSETASGWQQALFSTPVQITAGTLYVASYFAPNGRYPGDGGFFAGQGVDSGLLHAPADGVSGGQGVYRYGTSSGFPTSTYNSENYWVDVVYSTGGPGVPKAPSGVIATAGDESAVVSWTEPADGGSPITGYTVTPYIGGTAQTPTTVTGNPPATTTTVSGLTNGTAYTFRVAAINAFGSGAASTSSNTVTPRVPSPPTAPTDVVATAGDGSAVVSWSAPSSTGGGLISYTVTPYIGSVAQEPTTFSGNPPATTTTVTGLTNGTAYTFRVSATNPVGTGPLSAASNPVTPTPSTVPGVPTAVSAVAADASAVVSWSAPANGGSAITGYTVTP
ncbi:N,N-dimethylformamidase beta subunit family domain-containing protein, partial [Knoellia aerolata]